MTTPNQFFPDSSANYGGLAAFAAKSIEDWRNEVTGGFISATTLVQDAIQNFIAFISQIPIIGPIASAALQYLQDLIDNAGQATAAAVGTLIANLSTMLTQIGDIFDGVVVTPINTVVQQIKDWWTATGVDLPTAITNAGNAVGDIADIISNAAQSTAAQVGAALAGAVDGIDDVVANAIGGAAAAATVFGQAWEGAWAGWINAITGSAVATAQSAEVETTFAAQRDTIVGISTAVAQLQAAAAASGSSGVFGGDDFERTSSSNLGGAGHWEETYSGGDSSDGYIAIANGHQAAWVVGDPVTRSVFCRRTATTDQYTQTNFQTITWTVGGLGDMLAAGDPIWIRLYGRVKDDRTSYVFVEIRDSYPYIAQTMQFGYKNGGSETLIGSPVSCIYSSGDQFTFVVGDPDVDERYFKLLRNGSLVEDWDDSSAAVSAYGSSNLGWGFGAQAAAGPFASNQAKPASLDSITIADNGPGAFDFASLPAAGNAGRTYWCEDVGLALLDDGTDWRRVWGGPKCFFAAPPSTGWSDLNIGSATFTANKDAMLLTVPNNSGTESCHGKIRSLSPTINYTAEFYWEVTVNPVDIFLAAIILRESSSGKFVAFEFAENSANYPYGMVMRATKWTNYSTFSAVYVARYPQFGPGGPPNWVRFRDNGTTRYFEYSNNGVDWQILHSVGRTDFCTPDQIGVVGYNGNTGQPLYVRIRSLDGVA